MQTSPSSAARRPPGTTCGRNGGADRRAALASKEQRRPHIAWLARGHWKRRRLCITLRDTLDGEELVNQEVVINSGPHPEADSDFELFCGVVTEALGI
jgi:hypothetical protein